MNDFVFAGLVLDVCAFGVFVANIFIFMHFDKARKNFFSSVADFKKMHGELDLIDQSILLICEQNKILQRINAAQEATIDTLMIEYCPQKMTSEQMARWEKHQVENSIH